MDDVFELKWKDDYDFVDRDDRSIALPGRPYLALQLRRLGPLPPDAPIGTEREPS